MVYFPVDFKVRSSCCILYSWSFLKTKSFLKVVKIPAFLICPICKFSPKYALIHFWSTGSMTGLTTFYSYPLLIIFSLPFNAVISLICCISFFFFIPHSKTFRKLLLCTLYIFPEFPSVHSQFYGPSLISLIVRGNKPKSLHIYKQK